MITGATKHPTINMAKYYALTKSELARLVPCSTATMAKYIRSIEKSLPDYKRTQHLLTPAQVQIIATHFCIDIPTKAE